MFIVFLQNLKLLILQAIIEQDENTSEFSAYLNYQYNTDRFIFEPGFRLQKYNLETSPNSTELE